MGDVLPCLRFIQIERHIMLRIFRIPVSGVEWTALDNPSQGYDAFNVVKNPRDKSDFVGTRQLELCHGRNQDLLVTSLHPNKAFDGRLLVFSRLLDKIL